MTARKGGVLAAKAAEAQCKGSYLAGGGAEPEDAGRAGEVGEHPPAPDLQLRSLLPATRR